MINMISDEWSYGTGKITSKGIHFRGLYYSCNIALKKQWYHLVLIQGTREIKIKFNFSDLSYIKLLEYGREVCRLIECEKFSGERLEQYYSKISMYKVSKRNMNQNPFNTSQDNKTWKEFNGK